MSRDLWRPSEDNAKPLDAEKVWNAALQTYVWRLTPAGGGSSALFLDDVGGGVSYVGVAAPGSATSAAVWQIKRITEGTDGDVSLQWADGNADFDNVWDNRASLSYS